MKELFFIIAIIFLKNFLFNTEFVVYITFFSLFFIIYVISADNASNYFDKERSQLKETVLNHLTSVNNGLNSKHAETLEIQSLKAAQFIPN